MQSYSPYGLTQINHWMVCLSNLPVNSIRNFDWKAEKNVMEKWYFRTKIWWRECGEIQQARGWKSQESTDKNNSHVQQTFTNSLGGSDKSCQGQNVLEAHTSFVESHSIFTANNEYSESVGCRLCTWKCDWHIVSTQYKLHIVLRWVLLLSHFKGEGTET